MISAFYFRSVSWHRLTRRSRDRASTPGVKRAGRLADLPNAEATESLAQTIADMPQNLWNSIR
jgi:hypothetical protein